MNSQQCTPDSSIQVTMTEKDKKKVPASEIFLGHATAFVHREYVVQLVEVEVCRIPYIIPFWTSPTLVQIGERACLEIEIPTLKVENKFATYLPALDKAI